MSNLRSALRNGSTALIVAGLLSAGSLTSAADNKKQAPAPPPQRQAPPPPPRQAPPPQRPAAQPSGNYGGQRPSTSSPSYNRPTTSSPSYNHPTTSSPSVYRPTTSSPSAYRPNTSSPAVGRPAMSSPAMHGGAAMNARGTTNTTFHSPTPRGAIEHTTRSGSAVRIGPKGNVRDVHNATRGMDVHHGLNGNRRVAVERADHSRLVAERGRPGYVQRGYSYRGHDFGRRSYYYHGREYNRFYRGYGYRGLNLNVYAPGSYYGHGFYGWAYNPWAMPIAFGWGWGGNPWYGYYGGYFQPYATYPSASYWLTDYMISQDLQTAYAAQQEAGEVDGAQATAGGPPELTPDVKQQIADEIRNQLALENQEATLTEQHQDVDPASSGIARMLADGHPHVFVAGSALDLVNADGQECAISDGDALAMRTPPPADAQAADLVVLASKGGQECPKNSTVTVQLTDLQEMQNQMRATIDQGLQELQAKQGTGGLPQAPPSAQVKPTQPEYATIAPPPNPSDAADLQQQAQQADQAEKEVTAEASQPSTTQ